MLVVAMESVSKFGVDEAEEGICTQKGGAHSQRHFSAA